ASRTSVTASARRSRASSSPGSSGDSISTSVSSTSISISAMSAPLLQLLPQDAADARDGDFDDAVQLGGGDPLAAGRLPGRGPDHLADDGHELADDAQDLHGGAPVVDGWWTVRAGPRARRRPSPQGPAARTRARRRGSHGSGPPSAR